MKFSFYHFLGSWLVVSQLVACTHGSKWSKLEQIPLGTDKSLIVEQFGSPTQTLRRQDADYWIYKFYKGSEEYFRFLVFHSSKLVFLSEEELVLQRSDVELFNDLYRTRFSTPPTSSTP